MNSEFVTLFGWFSVGVGLALGVLWSLVPPSTKRKPAHHSETANDRASFLFDGAELVDESMNARDVIGLDPDLALDWPTLAAPIGARVTGFPNDLSQLGESVRKSYPAINLLDGAVAQTERWGTMARITLTNWTRPLANPVSATMAEAGASLQVPTLAEAPHPVWQVNDKNEPVWANAAYQKLASAHATDTPAHQFAPLFDTAEISPEGNGVRVQLDCENTSCAVWFDIVALKSGDTTTFYATDATAVVKAELAQRNFVQTLTKTFAQLSIGLAIFDRNRQLALFNPALIDLTALSAEFLSARPNLLSFFDGMRENRMIPEPKNYSNWREQIAELVVAAADGRYSETWSLPNGLTYRVSGKPHPNGAIALIFEDISAEISVTRRFRAEIEMTQALFDSIIEAVALFSPSGVLTFSNELYRDMWGIDPEVDMSDHTVRDNYQVWTENSPQDSQWSKVKDALLNEETRNDWEAEITQVGGGCLKIRVISVMGGKMVAMRRCNPPDNLVQNLRDSLQAV